MVSLLRAVLSVSVAVAAADPESGHGHGHGHSHSHGHGHGPLSEEFQQLIDANWTERMANTKVKFIEFDGENQKEGFPEEAPEGMVESDDWPAVSECALSTLQMPPTGHCLPHRPGVIHSSGPNDAESAVQCAADPPAALQQSFSSANSEGQCSCEMLNTIMSYIGLIASKRDEYFSQPVRRCCGARRSRRSRRKMQDGYFNPDAEYEEYDDGIMRIDEDPGPPPGMKLDYDPSDLGDPETMSTEDILRGLRQGSSQDPSEYTPFPTPRPKPSPIEPWTASRFAQEKENLIRGITRDYATFFNPMQLALYAPEVQFVDPLYSLSGRDAYKSNAHMLSGLTGLGKMLFSDCSLKLHNVSKTAPHLQELRTRWTLQFRVKLLPWKPLATFSGISDYQLDHEARVIRQEDYWDSIELVPGGKDVYKRSGKLAAIIDVLQQLAPKNQAKAASSVELEYTVLRRHNEYEVRRYPQHLAAVTECAVRTEGWAALGAYFGGMNVMGEAINAFVPSITSVPRMGRTKELKVMRWGITTDINEAKQYWQQLQPTGGAAEAVQLQLVPESVIAVYPFTGATTEFEIRENAQELRKLLAVDGLKPMPDELVTSLEIAQYDAINSLRPRRSEIWIALARHDWRRR